MVVLKIYGHDQVYVLPGGAAAWQEACQPWTTEVVQPPHKTFMARPRPAMRTTKAQVLNTIHDPDTTIPRNDVTTILARLLCSRSAMCPELSDISILFELSRRSGSVVSCAAYKNRVECTG
jgi:3-mercaptopyruvate sulfurtransferase SseA